MNVFIPHKKDFNIYLDEIMNCSSFNFTFGVVQDYNSNYDIVNIQFPEAIFKWIKPSKLELDNLEKCMIDWKKHSKIVLTFNDHVSHYDDNNEFEDLFNLIHCYCDGVIHLGNYSLNKFKSLFSKECLHEVIYHPLYVSLTGNYKTENIQSKFDVVLKDKYVVSVIGNVRSIEEMEFILKTFKKIPIKNKFLLVPKMFNFLTLPKHLPYRFRKIYRMIIEKWYCFPLKKNQYIFGYTFINYNMVVDLLNKTSLMIVPRLRSLNSGILFIGLTFNKPMLITKTGNLTEVAEKFSFPLLDLEKNNFKEVISELTNENFSAMLETEECKIKKQQFHPKQIASEYERFFRNLINT